MPIHVAEVVQSLKKIAPPEFAAEWDNVGLLIGSEQWDADPVILTIDLTEPVLREATQAGTKMIVAYHPPVFQPLKSLTDSEPRQRIALGAAGLGIAVYSPHTALDSAPGGINDWIAEGLGTGDVRALTPGEQLPESEQCKVVTFVPAEAVDRVRDALTSVGAGRIGNYEQCSFEIAGTGTFFASEAARPVVGQKGARERVSEVRLEMVCPKAALGLATLAIRQFHPYEEPPIEIYQLLPRPQRNTGHGRRVVLDRKIALGTLVERVKHQLGVKQVQVALADGKPEKFQRIAICAGAGGAMLDEAVAQNCELFLTGEMRHHDVLSAQARGCTVILAGHTNTERGYLQVLRKKLQVAVKDLHVTVSRVDADPLRAM